MWALLSLRPRRWHCEGVVPNAFCPQGHGYSFYPVLPIKKQVSCATVRNRDCIRNLTSQSRPFIRHHRTKLSPFRKVVIVSAKSFREGSWEGHVEAQHEPALPWSREVSPLPQVLLLDVLSIKDRAFSSLCRIPGMTQSHPGPHCGGV